MSSKSNKQGLKRKVDQEVKGNTQNKKMKNSRATYSLATSLEMYEAETRKDPMRLEAIRALKDGTIGCCYCLPNSPCHVDIVAKLYMEEKQRLGQPVTFGMYI
jgi:hypothetical protein